MSYERKKLSFKPAKIDICNVKEIPKDASLIEELEIVGEVRNKGCVLKIDGDSFHMYNSSNVLQKHQLSRECTNEARLEAHWEGFMETKSRRGMNACAGR